MRRSVGPAITIIASAILAACGAQEDAGYESAKPTISSNPLHAYPGWAAPLLGTSIAKGFVVTKGCMGNVDLVTPHRTGADLEGWSWFPSAKAPIQRLIVINGDNRVVGAAETNMDRPDVSKALKQITSTKVGWRGETAETKGKVTIMGFTSDRSLCFVGAQKLG